MRKEVLVGKVHYTWVVAVAEMVHFAGKKADQAGVQMQDRASGHLVVVWLGRRVNSNIKTREVERHLPRLASREVMFCCPDMVAIKAHFSVSFMVVGNAKGSTNCACQG